MRWIVVVVFAVLAAASAARADPTPEQLRQLADLLRDPQMQEFLAKQAADAGAPVTAAGTAPSATPAPGEPPAPAASPASGAAPAPPAPAPAASGAPEATPAAGVAVPATGSAAAGARRPTMGATLGEELARTRTFLGEVFAAAPLLPEEFAAAHRRFHADTQDRRPLTTILLVAAFIALGRGLELGFRVLTAPLRNKVIALPTETPRERVRAALTRTVYGVMLLVVYAAGSIGTFVLFDWPPLLAELVLGYLIAILVVRLTLVAGRIILAPGAERFRLVPMATPAARFWFVWSAVLVGYFATVNVTLDALASLGVSPAAVYLVGLVAGLVLVALTLYVIWRHPRADGAEPGRQAHRLGAWLLSIAVVTIWLLLLSGSVAPFYIGVALLLLPLLLAGARRMVRHVVRRPDAAPDATPPLAAVTIERALRAILLIGGAYFIVWQAGADLDAMTTSDTLLARVLRGVVNALAILLLADIAWQVARAWIDLRLEESGRVAKASATVDAGELRRMARMRTLLPMLRNVLLVVVMVVAALMALSALGVDVAPLIAGAGVVGVAVGFGAQTLVKDVISGVFFLLDDAFRVGEYIESGSISGTVEAFSLRSIKLRHQRGMLHTVPFGAIEKVTNYSRDWAIDKFSLSVTYDTDLEKARKIVKQVGLQLKADPEFGPHIIEPLKMQGVQTFGDYAIELRCKMMTKPGEQFVIRRKAYAMVKAAFDANGIEFAFPTVVVSGGGDVASAAGQTLLDRTKAQATAGATSAVS